MENSKMMLMVECEDCHHKFGVGQEAAPNDIQHKRKYEVNGQSIYLTYYD